MFDLRPGSPEAYALTSVDLAALARAYGKMGGLDRVATIVKRVRGERPDKTLFRSEEHTSELQSLMRISYAVICLKKTIVAKKTHCQQITTARETESSPHMY